MEHTSTKPYLIRAIHEWCADNGLRPHIAVVVDERTIVPREFVRNGEIVLNVSPDATGRLQIGNELIEFEARFNRVAFAVSIPIDNVSAIYAAENGHGMAFDVPKALAIVEKDGDSDGATKASGAAPAPRGPALLEAVPSVPQDAADDADSPPSDEPPRAPGSGGKRPHLKRVK